jgi:hypothetical protein
VFSGGHGMLTGQLASKDCLRVFVWANGCPWQRTATCQTLARIGRLEVLVWAREIGCPWDEDVCARAAEAGNLEVLKWAREHDCPWHAVSMCDIAASAGHLDVLQWVREHGCPWAAHTLYVRCSGRAPEGAAVGAGRSTIARGMNMSAHSPLRAGTSRC